MSQQMKHVEELKEQSNNFCRLKPTRTKAVPPKGPALGVGFRHWGIAPTDRNLQQIGH